MERGRAMKTHVIFGALLGAALLSPSTYAGLKFQGLGDLPGWSFESAAWGVSSDGTVVVGSGYSALGEQAFRWTSSSGMVPIGGLPGFSWSTADSASANGAVVVGYCRVAAGVRAFRWTENTGAVSLGEFPFEVAETAAWAVSADGLVVGGDVGRPGLGYELMRWTEATGIVSLGNIPGGRSGFGSVHDMTPDGNVMVGVGYSAGFEAVRWTKATGVVGLGDFPGGEFQSQAQGVSEDGSVVVGSGYSASGVVPFRWTEAGGMEELGHLPGTGFSGTARDVSADGAVIVGQGHTEELGSQAFVWDKTNGMRSLQAVLADDYHLDMTGWVLLSAEGISADGLTIVGTGVDPNGDREAWVAVLPEPATLSLLALGGLALLRRRSK